MVWLHIIYNIAKRKASESAQLHGDWIPNAHWLHVSWVQLVSNQQVVMQLTFLLNIPHMQLAIVCFYVWWLLFCIKYYIKMITIYKRYLQYFMAIEVLICLLMMISSCKAKSSLKFSLIPESSLTFVSGSKQNKLLT